MVYLFTILLMTILLFQAIAFLTLWERHLLGLTQLRVGPSKVVFSGLFQPLLDGVKLLKKEQLIIFNASPLMFIVTPILSFTLLFMEWMILPYLYNITSFSLGLLFFLVVMGCSVYPILLAGILSKSKYGLLGSIRASSQTISFEILYSLLMLTLMMFMKSFLFHPMFNLLLSSWYIIFLLSILVEMNRAPFDFSEGESELVSGYNVEYSGAGFVLFFLKEYGSMLFFSVLSAVLFFNFNLIVIIGVFTLFLFIRSSLPRYRYDLLMNLFWTRLLPLVITLLLLSILIML